MNKQTKGIIAIVLSVVFVIAVFVFQSKTAAVQLPGGVTLSNLSGFREVTESDYVRGSDKAPLTLIEYSDLECPFCKMMHESILELSSEFISTGKLRWVYRHQPLESIHANARDLAIATECAGKQGGDEAFWKFVDGIFADSAKKFDMTKLPTIAKNNGLQVTTFMNCFAGKQTNDLVEEDIAEANKLGINGTPYGILIDTHGQTFPIARAYSADELRLIINSILKE